MMYLQPWMKKYFGVLRDLLYNYNKMDLYEYKEGIMDNLEILIEKLGYTGLKEYTEALKSGEASLEVLADNLTYHGSHFFRGDQWGFIPDVLEDIFDKEWIPKIWCVGCASGEEVYSLLLLIEDINPTNVFEKNFELICSDINAEMIELTKKGEYGPSHFSEIPDKYQSYVTHESSHFKFNDSLRNKITKTSICDLLADDYEMDCDLIVCRNAIKFFEREYKVPEIQRKLIKSLKKGGYLFLSNDDKDNYEKIVKPEEMGVRLVKDTEVIYQKI